MMIEKEYPRLLKKGLEEGLKFWGLDKETDIDIIVSFISNVDNILKGISKLDSVENRVLTYLFIKGGKAEKENLRRILQKECELEKAISGLEKKLFIYLRKDRSTLTDRHDKIYIYPVIFSELKKLKILESEGLRIFLDKYYKSLYRSKNIPLIIKRVLLYGGVFFRPDIESILNTTSCMLDVSALSPYLLMFQEKFYPFYLPQITDKGLLDGKSRNEAVMKKGDKTTHELKKEIPADFNLSDFIVKATLICDVLHHSPKIRKSGIKRKVEGSGFTLSEDECQKIIEDLKVASVVRIHDEEGIKVAGEFLYGSYEEKVEYIKSILCEEENRIIAEIRKLGPVRIDIIISIFIRNLRLQKGYFFLTEKETLDVYKSYLEKINNLAFWGFLQKDFSGIFIRSTDMDAEIPEAKFLQVNADGEIFAYKEYLNNYAYYLLCGFTRLVSAEKILKFKLDRDSILRGIALFDKIDKFLNLIESCSMGKPQCSVIETIKAWSREKAKVRIGRRYVLKIDERLKLRIMGNDKLRDMIETDSGNYIMFKENIDPFRLKTLLREENIFII